MSKFIDILDAYINFSLSDKQALETLFTQTEMNEVNNLTINNMTNVHGKSSGADDGNYLLNLSEGLRLYSTFGANTCYLDPDGDVSFGSDLAAPGTTAFKVFSTTQTYNSESFGAGDLLVGDNTSGKANLHWDQSTGQLKLRSGTDDGIILDTDGSLQSGNFQHDIAGWRIDADGDAYFNSVEVRGAIKSSVFAYDEVVASGTDLLITKNAGETYAAFTTPAALEDSFTLKVSTNDAGDRTVVAVDDVIRIKTWTGTAVVDIWAVATAVSTVSNVSTVTATLKSGATGASIQKATAVVAYGYSTQGGVHIQGGDYPRVDVLHVRNDYVKTVSLVAGGSGGYVTGDELTLVDAGSSGDAVVIVTASAGAVTGISSIDWGGYDYTTGTKTTTGGGGTGCTISVDTLSGPWDAGLDLKARIGDMYGSYGATSNHRFGIGLGDYATGNYLSYNAEVEDGFIMKVGDGGITLDSSGVTIDPAASDSWSGVEGVRWANETHEIGYIRGYEDASNRGITIEFDKTGLGPESDNRARRIDIFATSPIGYEAEIDIMAQTNYPTNRQAWIRLTADTTATPVTNIHVYSFDTIDIDAGDYVQVSNKGLVVGSTAPSALTGGQIQAEYGILSTGGVIRSEGTSDPTNQGDGGIEISWESTFGRVLAYGRGPTVSSDQPLQLRGSKIEFYEGGSVCLTLDNQDLYTQSFADYSSSTTTTGWSSFTVKEIYYKTVGDMVYVWVYLNGTSNGTTATFTLPYNTENSNQNVAQTVVRVGDNGTPAFGFINVPQNSNVCTAYRTASASTGWTASGTKYVIGQFCYQRA